jgi:hypothetical protein
MHYDQRENEFLGAMVESSDEGFDKKAWLIKHFDLYKSVSLWPRGLPPIKHGDVKAGTLACLFHNNYFKTLIEFDYTLDFEQFTLELRDELTEDY